MVQRGAECRFSQRACRNGISPRGICGRQGTQSSFIQPNGTARLPDVVFVIKRTKVGVRQLASFR